MFEKTEWTVTNEQSRNTGNIRHKSRNKTMSEKTDWIIKNRQSRDTGSISHKTQNKDIQQKTKNTEKEEYEQHGPNQRRR